MYNLLSLMFLITGLFSIGKFEFKWIVFIFALSVGFAIAGSIGSLSSSIDNLFNGKVKYNKTNFVDGSSEIIFKKEKNNIINTNKE